MLFHPGLLAAGYEVEVPSTLADPFVLAGGVGIVLLLVSSLATARRYPIPSLAVMWLLITISPTSSFVPGPLLMDEDRTYLPFLAIYMVLGAAGALLWVGKRKWKVALVAGVAIVGAMLSTSARCVTWSDRIWIWLDAIGKYPGAVNAQGGLCLQLSVSPDRVNEAVSACTTALQQWPQSTSIGSALVRSLARMGRLKEANEVADRLLLKNPSDPQLLNMAGHLAWQQDRPHLAIPKYEASLRKSPWDIHAMLYLAKCYLEVGARNKVGKLIAQAERLHPTSPDQLLWLAEMHIVLGDLDRSQALLQRLGRERPDHPETLLAMTQLAQRRGKLRESMRLLDRVEVLASKDPNTMLRVARARLRGKDFTGATRILRRLNAQFPKADHAKLLLVVALLDAGRLPEACRLFGELTGAPNPSAATIRHYERAQRRCRENPPPVQNDGAP